MAAAGGPLPPPSQRLRFEFVKLKNELQLIPIKVGCLSGCAGPGEPGLTWFFFSPPRVCESSAASEGFGSSAASLPAEEEEEEEDVRTAFLQLQTVIHLTLNILPLCFCCQV